MIYLFQAGAPSQLDLFDYKPELANYTGKPVPQEFVKGINYAFIKPDAGSLCFGVQIRPARPVGCRDLGSDAPPDPGR